MIEEEYDENRLLTAAKLFSNSFEDLSRFAYHGTSTLFADEIETNGFQYPYNAVSEEDLCTLAESIPAVEAQLAQTIRDAVRPTRLSFTPISYAAVDYALTGGGQVVLLCKQGVEAGGIVSPAMQAQLARLTAAEPCVYVVDLSDSVGLDLASNGLFIFSKTSVPASRVVAKMLIPREFDMTRFQRLQKMRHIAVTCRTLGSLVLKMKHA